MNIEPQVLIDNTVVAYLNIDDLDMPKENIAPTLLQFQVSTYDILTRVRKRVTPGTNTRIQDPGWDVIFANVNQFLQGLSKEQQVTVAQSFILMHNTITEFFKQNTDLLMINQMLHAVGTQLDELDQAMDLTGQLRNYVDNNMFVGVYEGAGKRAQDSDILTFQPEQVRTLMSITLLCKLLSPVFGTIMAHLKKKIDNKLKEAHSVVILKRLFDRRFPALIEKLMYYINNTVEHHHEESASSIMHGFDTMSMTQHMYGILMTRQFVNVDLRVKNGNLMTYIIVSIKRAINTVRSAIKNNPTCSRKPIAAKHDDDGNTSQLEIDSMISKKTLDVCPLINAAIEPVIKKLMAKYQIDEEAYQQSLKFYLNNPIVPNPINKDVNAMFFAKELGGGNGLLMLHGTEYTKLTALMQLIIFSLDINYTELGHLMTANVADTAIDTTINNSMFQVRVGSSQYYRSVKQLFDSNPYGIKGKDWDNHIKRITDIIITNKYVYNSSNFIWNWLDEDNLNNKVFTASDITITSMCSLYEFYITSESI